MKFTLFSRKIEFEVYSPIALIESYCFQSNFFANYDVIENKNISEHVNKIGARISEKLLKKCAKIVNEEINVENLRIFKFHELESFLKDDHKDVYIREFYDRAIRKLSVDGIGLSKATKILHTLHPEIIPMLDNPLQELYHKDVNQRWPREEPEKIFIDYYDNLKKGDNLKNLKEIYDTLRKNHLLLTKVRIFDILWWSYLKSQNLNERLKKKYRKPINWQTIR